MEQDAKSDTGAYQIALFALRHPLKAVVLIVVATLGYALAADVGLMTEVIRVRTGQTAEAHRSAEGIEI